MSRFNKENENDVLRDSLESFDENISSCPDCEVLDEVKQVETLEELHETTKKTVGNHGKNLLPVNSSNMDNEDAQKLASSSSKRFKKKKAVVKLPERNIIELNKTNVFNGCPKMSYSEMYQRKFSVEKASRMTKTKDDESKKSSSTAHENPVKQVAQGLLDGLLDEIAGNTRGLSANELEMYGKMYGNSDDPELASSERDFHGHSTPHHRDKATDSLQWDKHCNEQGQCGSYSSLNSNVISNNDYNSYHQTMNYPYNDNADTKNMGGAGVNHIINKNDAFLSQYFPPIQLVPTSVRSAPADIETYQVRNDQSNQKLVLYRRSSLSAIGSKKKNSSYCKLNDSVKSSSSQASLKCGSTGYGGISTKQQTYEPYTLSDYKKLKQVGISGGLGPNTNSEEHREKIKKAIRQKEYAAVVRQKHRPDNTQSKTKPAASVQNVNSLKVQEAYARRSKALEYAKAVPKPAKMSVATPKLKAKAENKQEEAYTLLDILRQRHEKEKKAVDAVRSDLQAKLKTR